MKVFPGKNEQVITTSIFSFVFGLALGLIVNLHSEDLIVGIITLIAAFSGAYFAFKFNERSARRELIENNVKAANKAIFNLISIYNSLGGYRRQYISPFIDNPLRHFAIQPSIGFQKWMKEFDFDDLIYLVESQNPNILNELFEIQAEVITTIDLVEERNEIHYRKIQPAMTKAGIKQGDDVKESQFNSILEEYDISLVKNYTDDLINVVDNILARAEKLIQLMQEINIKMYPTEKIIGMKKLNKPIHATSA